MQQMLKRKWKQVLVGVLGLVIMPAVASAQSAMAGVVKDDTGAVMPGVTVEAASPVLIEKVRSVVSDGQGQYKIVDLRPGTYSVTFSLTGFNTVKRDGVELPSGVTAQINADLKVGSLEETITVSGQAAVVDVQNAVQQTVLTRQVLDALPTGRSIPTLGALLSGARLSVPDVGGTSGMQNRDLLVHGSDARDVTFQIDGMTLNGYETDGSVQSYFDDAMFEEISYQTSGISAEVSAGGVRANMIPKDGGNQFKGSLFLSAANQSLQANNAADAMAKGLQAPSALSKVWDLNGAQGGPLRQNRLWFFSSYRDWGVYQYTANSYDKEGNQTIDDASIRSGMVRLTTQLGSKNKISGYLARIRKWRGHEGASLQTSEATTVRLPKQYYHSEFKWTSTVSNRLLFEAGMAINNESYTREPRPEGVGAMPKQDTILGTYWGAYTAGLWYKEPIRETVMGSMSYVTGSHAFKAGIQYGWGHDWNQRTEPFDRVQLYRNGVPSQVQIHNTPVDSYTAMNADQGIYAMDSWTLGRFTINPGVRFEHFNSQIGARDIAPGTYVPARHFDARENLPNWNDVAPRIGFAWDVHGNGKMAIKAGTGKYMRSYTSGFADVYDPNGYSTANVTWTDVNKDDLAQGTRGCVYLTPGCEIDFGTLATSFGVKPSQNPADGIRRPYQIETNISVQREIVSGTSVTVSYFRRDYQNLIWSDNLLISPSDYTPFTVPNPLGNGETVTIYNLNPARAGQVNILDNNTTVNQRKYTGVDVNFNARVKGLTLFGGVSTGHAIASTCEVEDQNRLRYCDQSQYGIPNYTQIKVSGSYQLPWKIAVSGALQSLPGDARNVSVDSHLVSSPTDPSLRVNWNVDRATFKSLTGATLTQSSVTIPLNEPGSKLLSRQNQLDIRFKRVFKVGAISLEAQADAYNALNTGVVLTSNQTYGANLDKPLTILQGRLFRFGMQARW